MFCKRGNDSIHILQPVNRETKLLVLHHAQSLTEAHISSVRSGDLMPLTKLNAKKKKSLGSNTKKIGFC